MIFRVILSLLQVHKDELLKLDCFEDIMDYLKNVIPKVNESTMTKVFKNVYTLNIARQLMDYKIEYNVLKEEIRNTNQHVENLKHSKEENQALQRQVQIAESNIDRLENIRHTQQQEITSMQSQIQSLEVTIQTLGDYLTSLSIHRTDIDIPSDIRRLLQQLEYQQNQQKQQQIKRRTIFLDRKIGKSVSVNNSMGMSLKVLVEQNENDQSLLQTPPAALTPTPVTPPAESSTSPSVTKKTYFDNLKAHIKHQDSHKLTNSNILNRESPEKARIVEQASICEEPEPEVHSSDESHSSSEHPLFSSDINFQFNTMQLKSIKTTNNLRKKWKLSRALFKFKAF